MGKTVSDYLAEICGSPAASAIYAYRGQEDSRWPLRSAAARRLLRHYRAGSEREVPYFSRAYIEYHQNVLIDPARTRGFGLDNGRMLSDLEILATLQHFGAATGLLDFTYSPLIALWFACPNENVTEKSFPSTPPIRWHLARSLTRLCRRKSQEFSPPVLMLVVHCRGFGSLSLPEMLRHECLFSTVYSSLGDHLLLRVLLEKSLSEKNTRSIFGRNWK